MFLAVGGGSVGFQIGGSFTDVVMLFMNERALQSLLNDKFKMGADATVAAGPVGRNAAAATDAKLNAEILNGKVAVPAPARSLVEELAKYAAHR
jgi:SH3 domain-containing YSC84-like protein 1